MEEKAEKTETVSKEEQIKKDYKAVNKIIFLPNEDVPDDWTDFEMTKEEFSILKSGEKYIEDELIPSLSISKKFKEIELTNIRKPEQSKEKNQIDDDELIEIDSLLKAKTKELKVKKEKTILKNREEERKRKELEDINREK